MGTFVCVLALVALFFSANVIFSVNSHIEKALKTILGAQRKFGVDLYQLRLDYDDLKSSLEYLTNMVVDISDAIVNETDDDDTAPYTHNGWSSGEYDPTYYGWSSDDESGDTIEWKDTCDEIYQPKLPGFDDNESIVVWTNDSVHGVKTEYYKR